MQRCTYLSLPGLPTHSHRTILVVDDDPDIRTLTRTFLEHEGYHVYTSGDTQRASQIFHRADHIDLLITDFYLPESSGMQLALELKAEHPELPVLVISGAFIPPDQIQDMQNHGWTFLAKPFSFPDLLSNVHEILQLPQRELTDQSS